jgi:phosphoenolpyruvate carboxykinase (ATP)
MLATSLENYGLRNKKVIRNAPAAVLYEEAIKFEPGTMIANSGALVAMSGEKTGRSPKDKRLVRHANSQEDVWWGNINMEVTEHTFMLNRQRALDYIDLRDRIYVFDGYAGWDPDHQIKVRIIATRAYHALFMNNMLIRPTAEQLETFGEPDFVIFNAGVFPANPYTEGMTSATSVAMSFERGEMVILGSEYAGEMKKGIFTLMHYLMPRKGVLSMHCSANEGDTPDDVAVFFGLSGTGKTTLSADPNRKLIGDDEHCWSDTGVFNIEGGCYAKCIDLSREKEPEIFDAVRFGAVLENVVIDSSTRVVDYHDDTITQNTRTAYPIEFIPNAKIPCVGGHPKNIIFLTADAFGVLPPVSRLTPEQAMYHFISGYTAKVAGTEMGVTEPQATFSACFGAAFLVWPPTKYAEMLAEKMREHGAKAWLVNTGWTGGPHGIGHRINLKHTRSIIDAIHSGALNDIATVVDPYFGVSVPVSVPSVPTELLTPKNTWSDKDDFEKMAKKLVDLFGKNFAQYESFASAEIKAAAPKY